MIVGDPMLSGTNLIKKLLLIGAISIVTPVDDKAYSQEVNQDGSSCSAFMRLFGYLDRARSRCEFGRLQSKLDKIAKNCLASSATEGLKFYNEGAAEFQRGFDIEDKKQACERVSLQFASAFQSNEFAALDRKDSLVQSALAAGEFLKALALAKELEVEAKATAGPSSRQYASALNAIGIVYFLMGKEKDAVSALQRALPLIQSAYGENSSEHAKVLNNLAEALFRLSRYKESAQIYRRALDAHEKADGSNKIDVAETAMGLANALSELGQYAEAERLFKKATEYQAGLGTNLLLAGIQHNLGVMARRRNNDKEAEEYYKQAIQIFETLGANEHPDLAGSLVDLGDLYFYSNRIPQSESLYRKALHINEKTLGIENFRTAQSLDKLSRALLLNTLSDEKSSNQRERLSEYLEFRRRASLALIRTIDATGDASGADRGVFSRHLAALEFMGRMSSQAERRNIEAEQFEIAQRVVQLSAGTALRQAAIRMSKGDARLDAAIRERAILYSRYQSVQKDLIRAIAQNSLERANSSREEERRLDTRLSVLTERIQKNFPQFSSLSSAKAIQVPQVQNSLKPDEALIFVVDNGTYVHVFALTKDRFQTYTIENFGNPTKAALSEPEKLEQNKKLVLRFRKGLNPDSVDGSAGGEQFDLEFAHSIFERLFGPLDSYISVRRHWLIVPSGAFTALPFHLLVTDSAGVQEPKDGFRKFREAEWLIRSHAITILPSVESLDLLRALAGKSSAPLPLIGFADPNFGAVQNANFGSRSSRAITRSYSEFWNGQKIDRKLLQSALAAAPLPESAQELLFIAQKLKVTSDSIRLGGRASESEVKKARLREYRIVYFATHGLVAGEVKGLAEPALALAWPKTPTSLDDGLLTASEVAGLSLNADWVVLSACNTIAGQSPDAEPLSGLARAFFYAGARALLVSHWAVETNAAARLAVSTFEKLAASPKIGKSEALRQSMVEFLRDESDPRNSHPAIWGPFVVIGEGGAN